MTKSVDVYWSHQSPYCYFALDRILTINARPDVEMVLRLVLPGVLRNAGAFSDRPPMEQDYFLTDVKRTAAYLGLPYGEARPYPVAMQRGTLYRAEQSQPRIHHLNHLTAAADEAGKGWAFLDQVARLIWDGTTKNWHTGQALADATARAGLDHGDLTRRAKENADAYDALFAANHERLLAAGHWGVPVFVHEGEPFYGQDRFDQLLWRMGFKQPGSSDAG
ncbi:2-hydroxychromene-2-carboxylate isomerase [Hoeflea sp. TYP-13]|uniref:2-hydroxychromene-2-carboxylate isomerase n=1 Tax=Hoeflea sp. TYP-13 TaxID=3230023 RepID=UPI0034C66038